MNGFAVVCALASTLLLTACSTVVPECVQDNPESKSHPRQSEPVRISIDYAKKEEAALKGLWPKDENIVWKEHRQRDSFSFDVNNYFSVLRHVRMEEGYMLDYIYHFGGLGGGPVLYARKTMAQPYSTDTDLSEANERGEVEKWLDHVRVDGTPEGYFELVLLILYGDQFCLFSHSDYGSKILLCDKKQFKKVAQKPDPQVAFDKRRAERTDCQPRVYLSDSQVMAILYTFNDWEGLVENVFVWDHKASCVPTDHKESVLVPYDCGIRY